MQTPPIISPARKVKSSIEGLHDFKQSDCKLTGQRKGFHDQLAQLEVRSYSSEAGSPQLCGLSPLQFIEIVKVVIMMVIIITYVRLGRVAHSHMSRTNKLVALYMSRFTCGPVHASILMREET